MVKIKVRIWEVVGRKATPVLDHVFMGETLKQALRIERAHRKTDEFYQGIVETGRYEDIVGEFEAVVKESGQLRSKIIDLETGRVYDA